MTVLLCNYYFFLQDLFWWPNYNVEELIFRSPCPANLDAVHRLDTIYLSIHDVS